MRKYFGDVRAVDNVDLMVPNGSFVTLLGPSGCGKTTTIRCIAGLEKPDSGEIYIGDRLVASCEKSIFVPTEKRNLGMVFQSYAVWPHMTVFENVEYPLRARHFPKSKRASMVNAVLDLVRLQGLEQRYPGELSGGQQQRVALARALVYEPEVLLLDEPLSNLDAKLRESMRLEIKDLQRKLGITTVYVTHDQLEALVMSDTVCVMDNGNIVQIGDPLEVYQKPASRFCADFIGTSNFLEGEIVENLGVVNGCQLYRSTVEGDLEVICSPCGEMKVGDRVSISIRPEYIRLVSAQKAGRPNVFVSSVERKTFVGDRIRYLFQLGGKTISFFTAPDVDLPVGKEVHVKIQPVHCLAIKKSV